MFVKCFKNYFSCLRYVFGVLGILFLALLIGGGVFISGSAREFGTMVDSIRQTTGQSDLSTSRIWDAVKNDLLDEVTSEDGLVSMDEAKNTTTVSVTDALSTTVDNYVDYVSQISSIILEMVQNIFYLLIIMVVIQLVGLLVGRSYVLICAGADIEHRNILKTIGARLFIDLMLFVFLLLIGLVFSFIPMAGIILIILFPIIYSMIALFGANLCIGSKKRLPVGKALAVKNILVILAANIVQLIVTAVIAVGVFYLFNPVAAVYAALSLAIIAFASLSLNANTIIYRLSEAEDGLTTEKAEEKIEEKTEEKTEEKQENTPKTGKSDPEENADKPREDNVETADNEEISSEGDQ